MTGGEIVLGFGVVVALLLLGLALAAWIAGWGRRR